ncbi:MAG: glycosyltransferase family 1 protein [Roseiflexaceae bacterium]
MRIAIDARLNAYRQGGIPQYTRQLITALADVATEDQIVSFQHRDQLRPLAIAPNVVRRTALTPPHHRFEQWTLPLEVLLARPDVLHCPDFIAPTRRPCPAVVTIHDLAFMHYPEILDASARAYYGQVIANAPRADAIIAVSESTRQDIAQFLDIPIEQIDVIYEAAAPLYTQLELREGEARVLNSTPVAAGTFMLFVSTLEPRKNLPTLLQALRICLDRRPEAGYRLVIVGRRGWRDEVIFQTARDLKLADHVLFTGGVGQYDLRWLYNACRLYINPSLYEGFGLPLLEAMACGAPCLAAATSSLPEIGGEAAIYVPPLEAEQWADEIMALWDDEDRRAELGRMGVARAQQFSWNRAARETLKVYRRAVERIVPRAEPLPSTRYAPSEPLPVPNLVVLGPDSPRPCLRCGTTLLPGELQLGVSMAPRVWSCPRCGYVELVNETHQAAHTGHAATDVEQPVQSLPLPVLPEADSLAEADLDDLASAAPNNLDSRDVEPIDQPAGWEDESSDELAAPIDVEPVGLEDESSDELAAPIDVEPIGLEDESSDELAAPIDVEPTNAPAELEDLTVASVAPADAESAEELAEREAGAVAHADPYAYAHAKLPDALLLDMPIQDPAADTDSEQIPEPIDPLDPPPQPDGSAPAIAAATAQNAHSPQSSNGTTPKPRSGRGSRRQPPAAEPAAKPAAKRRSSGSKRKQTT